MNRFLYNTNQQPGGWSMTMIDRENAVQTPEFTQLNQPQLDTLQQLCEAQVVDKDQTLLSRLQLYTHAITTHNPYGGKDAYWAHRSSESINNDTVLADTYKHVYETDDPEVIRRLFSLDLFAWNKLYALSNQYFRTATPDSYPEDDVYHLDAGYTYDVLSGAQPRFKVPLQYSLYVKRADEYPDQDPAIIKRLLFGMPRSLQLTGLALMMRNFGAQTYASAKYEASRLAGVADFLQLSDTELHTAVKLGIPYMSIRRSGDNLVHEAPKLLNTVLTNDRLMQRFQTKGAFDPSSFGGHASLVKVIQMQFREVAATNAYDHESSNLYVIRQWRKLSSLLGSDFMEQTVPKEERTRQVIMNALDALTRDNVTYDKLSPNIESMIDTQEFANACWDVYSFWQDNPEEAFELGRRYQAPISLRTRRLEEAGIPNLHPDALLDLERPCNKLLEHVSKYATQDSEMYKIATERIDAATRYDPELFQLLERSTNIVNHDDLRVFRDGFDDSEETTKWIIERAARAKLLRAELEEVTEKIRDRVNQLLG